MENPRNSLVSIIITTKNEEDTLTSLLESIGKQIYKSKEIIIVDNKSTDSTLEITEKFGIKTYTFGPERSAQRNFGANKAKGKFLLFLDADMELTPKVLSDCMRLIIKEKTAGVIIAEQSIASNFWGKVKAFERSFYNNEGDSITDAARFFSKKIFTKVGGYDESITGPEDWDLSGRIEEMGLKISRSKEKIYHHEQNISLFFLFAKKFYYGLNAHIYLEKHKIPLLGPKTIYFLRPVFLNQAEKLVEHPILSLGLFCMFCIELIGGGLGYLLGKLDSK